MRYFFIDQLLEMEPGVRVVTKKNITATEDCFRDHFPGFPIYPGALLLEAMAQTGGLLIEKTIRLQQGRQVLPILSIVKNAKFRGAVLPGDSLRIEVAQEHISEDAAGVNGVIKCDDTVRVTAKIMYSLVDVKRDLGIEEMPEINGVQDTLVKLNNMRSQYEKSVFGKRTEK